MRAKTKIFPQLCIINYAFYSKTGGAGTSLGENKPPVYGNLGQKPLAGWTDYLSRKTKKDKIFKKILKKRRGIIPIFENICYNKAYYKLYARGKICFRTLR